MAKEEIRIKTLKVFNFQISKYLAKKGIISKN